MPDQEFLARVIHGRGEGVTIGVVGAVDAQGEVTTQDDVVVVVPVDPAHRYEAADQRRCVAAQLVRHGAVEGDAPGQAAFVQAQRDDDAAVGGELLPPAAASKPPPQLWATARFAGTVALGSAAISYGHLRSVLLAWQYNTLAATVGPLVLDGLMIVSGFALLAITGTGKTL